MSGRFGVRSLRRRFPTDDACLEYIFRKRHERHCSCGGVFKRIKGRQQYHCSRCSFQVAPLAGTCIPRLSIGSGRTRKDRSGEPTNLFLRSTCSLIWTASSFITTTQARTRSGFSLYSITYCSIEQPEEASLFVHHSILPRLALKCLFNYQNHKI